MEVLLQEWSNLPRKNESKLQAQCAWGGLWPLLQKLVLAEGKRFCLCPSEQMSTFTSRFVRGLGSVEHRPHLHLSTVPESHGNFCFIHLRRTVSSYREPRGLDEECSVKRSSVLCQEWNVRGLLQDPSLLHCVTAAHVAVFPGKAAGVCHCQTRCQTTGRKEQKTSTQKSIQSKSIIQKVLGL